ncbi:hypothetical protein [Sphingosinicella humi]|uniref:DUF2927 domain-containing protein n=1 Tax=Allosphingosinicella humi TaxID=2068657 RepID=A0A2U2J2N7_9SPHN|nr:hypothetical protein [Sphingosinicella humi]PWG02606.1 hypothetical protein DF286_06795 [Sphingosinicella humi]
MTRPATRSTLATRCAAIALALTPAFPLCAEPPASPADDEIVVTGQRDREEAIHDFIETVTVEANGQMATFRVPVCPMSFGLPADYNEVVATRIREVASAAGVPLAEAGCDPNLVVIVADDSRDFFHAFRRDRPTLFHALELSEIKDVQKAEGPVRAWQVQLRGSDGRPARWVRFQVGGSMSPPRQMLDGVTPSRIQKGTRRDLSITFVVFDLAATDGLTLTQIADHAAMRTLARTEPADARAPSILALFNEDGPHPDSLTTWDAAYLKALYATNNTVAASQQQSNMARLIGKALGPEEAD